MKEWSDDELDELFRKSAEEFEPTYQANDWDDLSRRLDEADGVTGGGWLRSAAPWLAGALLLLLGGISTYYYGSKDGKTESNNKNVVMSTTETPTVNKSLSGPTANENRDGKSTDQPEKPSVATFNKIQDGGKSADRGKEVKPNRQKIVISEDKEQEFAAATEAAPKIKELPRNPASVSGVRKPTDPEKRRGEGVILLSKKASTTRIAENVSDNESEMTPLAENSVVEKAQINSGEISSTEKSPGILLKKPTTDALRNEWPALRKLSLRGEFREGNSPAYPAITYKAPEKTDIPASRQAVAHKPLWSVRIGISPDLSMVRVSEMMKSMRPGPSASLLVAYDMSPHLAIQTGVIRSLKTYNVQFNDYYGSEEWGNDPMPANIDGNAQVFEIPLNLRYDIGYGLSARQKCLWFIGLGVSSYKMQRETYTYNYDASIPGQQRSPKEMDKGTGWYFLSHANVSVGYEHRLTDRLSIIAEPHLRIPLRGVGFGKVNLFTTGVWFSVRYIPVFRK